MKIAVTSTLILAFLSIVFFTSFTVSEANIDLSFQTAQPTPPDKTNPETVAPRSACSPMPTPLSQEELNDPLREQTAEDVLNGLLGSMDVDCDGICNMKDNCIFVYNPDQKDNNGDGVGDACDPKLVDKSFMDLRCDMDGDGVPDNKDNCPWVCNPDQKFVDVNKNGVNDLCDNALADPITGKQPCPKRIKVKAPKVPRPQKSQ